MTVSIFKGAAQAALAVMLCAGLAGKSLDQGEGVTGSAGQSRAAWHGGLLATSLAYSETMLDRQSHVTDKIAVALRARQSGLLGINQLTFGGRVLGTVIHESTNTPGKFPILSRLPPTLANLTRLGIFNSRSNIWCYSTGLRVWHQATGTQYLTQLTHNAHGVG